MTITRLGMAALGLVALAGCVYVPIGTFSKVPVETLAGASTHPGQPGSPTDPGQSDSPFVEGQGSLALTEGRWLPPGEIQADSGMLAQTLVGSTSGFVDGDKAIAKMNIPQGLAYGPSGDLYFADYGNARVRKLTRDGKVETVAQFFDPSGLCVDATGDIYVAQDYHTPRIQRITPEGVVTTFSGTGAMADGQDAASGSAKFGDLAGLVADSHGNIFAVDNFYHKIRKFSPDGHMVTFAGTGTAGFKNDEDGTKAQFKSPMGLAIDSQDNLYVADTGNHRIRIITPDGKVDTFAGNGSSGGDHTTTTACLSNPLGIALLKNGDMVVGQLNNLVRLISKGKVYTVAGKAGNSSLKEGRGSEAQVPAITFMTAAPDGGVVFSTGYSGSSLLTLRF